MKKLAVETIIVPVEQGLSPEPAVAPEDRITEALEVLLENNLKQIAVVRDGQAVGMMRLEDALKKLGLEKGTKPKGPQSLVIHGRKIVVDRTDT
jgi:predicted transcriptional regulator